MELGVKIRMLRKKQGMTQNELAGDRITRNMLSKIENGEALPSLETLFYIAERLGIAPGFLLSEEEDSFEFEKKLSAMNTKIREKRAEQEVIFRQHTKNENRLTSLKNEQDKLATKLWDDYEMTRAEAVSLGYPPITAVTRAATAAKQADCRNKLRAIGNVDLDAVNKYKEVNEAFIRANL